MQILLELNSRQRNGTRLLTCLLGLVAFALLAGHAEACLALGALLALMLRRPAFVYAFAKTFRRDIVAAYRFVRLNAFIALMEWRRWTVARIFLEQVRRHPRKAALVMDERALTFAQAGALAGRVGAFFRARGLRRGDCVALLLETRPEYPCLWVGLSQLGVVSALINSHLRRETLLHSIKVAGAKAVVVGSELAPALQEVLDSDDAVRRLPLYEFADEEQRAAPGFALLPGAVDLAEALRLQPDEDLGAEVAAGRPSDRLLYVYTSGTTGLPKAAVITNLRYLFMCSGTHQMLGLRGDDVIYDPLPLYHTAGGIVGVGNALIHGCTIVLRRRFSASNFWRDCVRHECTVAQYIGELCRYLLATPPRPEDTRHRLRLMYGNGLRPQIWAQFVSRFAIPSVGEVYGSTEGNSNLANTTGQVGAIGFLPIAIRRLYPVQLVRCDEETGEPLRDAAGRCVRCRPGEPGLLIGRVDPRRAVTAFHGYADRAASEQKLLRDVFRPGDLFFNSGDLVVSDILGYFYFRDRTGDTFRWRGENVATQEVEAIITNVVGLQDCVVYGVEVPHVEGKAGMAAIVDPERRVDLAHLSAGVRGSLPPYAQPLFVRLMDAIPRTATFKLKKRELVLEGFDIRRISDPVFFLHRDGIYRPLTEELLGRLLEGTAGL